MFMHGSNMESVYKVIPMEMLPVEYLPDDYKEPNAGTVQSIVGKESSQYRSFLTTIVIFHIYTDCDVTILLFIYLRHMWFHPHGYC